MARIGLVLGAGGATGGAFHAGMLTALAAATGWDPRSATVILGTSAGSITAAMLRAGLSAADIAARTEGIPLSPEGAARLGSPGLSPGEAPPADAPGPGPGGDRRRRAPAGPSAPSVLWAAARRPWAVRPPAILAGLMPAGVRPTTVISDGVQALLGDRWPAAPMWVAALSLEDARLVIFGRERAPVATPGQAVAASCAVPGWFAPVRIGGDRYVDGGAHSLTNVAQLARARLDLDLVVVSAPMGRTGPGGVKGPWRRAARAQLALEAEVLRRRGVPVLAFQPTAEDQAVMGPDGMDATRRAPVVRQVRASTRARLRRPDVAARLALLTPNGRRP
jgi:NTE family protein